MNENLQAIIFMVVLPIIITLISLIISVKTKKMFSIVLTIIITILTVGSTSFFWYIYELAKGMGH